MDLKDLKEAGLEMPTVEEQKLQELESAREELLRDLKDETIKDTGAMQRSLKMINEMISKIKDEGYRFERDVENSRRVIDYFSNDKSIKLEEMDLYTTGNKKKYNILFYLLNVKGGFDAFRIDCDGEEDAREFGKLLSTRTITFLGGYKKIGGKEVKSYHDQEQKKIPSLDEFYKQEIARKGITCNCGGPQYGTDHSPDCELLLAWDEAKDLYNDLFNQQEISDHITCTRCGCKISDADHDDNHGLCNNCSE